MYNSNSVKLKRFEFSKTVYYQPKLINLPIYIMHAKQSRKNLRIHIILWNDPKASSFLHHLCLLPDLNSAQNKASFFNTRESAAPHLCTPKLKKSKNMYRINSSHSQKCFNVIDLQRAWTILLTSFFLFFFSFFFFLFCCLKEGRDI